MRSSSHVANTYSVSRSSSRKSVASGSRAPHARRFGRELFDLRRSVASRSVASRSVEARPRARLRVEPRRWEGASGSAPACARWTPCTRREPGALHRRDRHMCATRALTRTSRAASETSRASAKAPDWGEKGADHTFGPSEVNDKRHIGRIMRSPQRHVGRTPRSPLRGGIPPSGPGSSGGHDPKSEPAPFRNEKDARSPFHRALKEHHRVGSAAIRARLDFESSCDRMVREREGALDPAWVRLWSREFLHSFPWPLLLPLQAPFVTTLPSRSKISCGRNGHS